METPLVGSYAEASASAKKAERGTLEEGYFKIDAKDCDQKMR